MAVKVAAKITSPFVICGVRDPSDQVVAVTPGGDLVVRQLLHHGGHQPVDERVGLVDVDWFALGMGVDRVYHVGN
jgi:hypothetical protein